MHSLTAKLQQSPWCFVSPTAQQVIDVAQPQKHPLQGEILLSPLAIMTFCYFLRTHESSHFATLLILVWLVVVSHPAQTRLTCQAGKHWLQCVCVGVLFRMRLFRLNFWLFFVTICHTFTIQFQIEATVL